MDGDNDNMPANDSGEATRAANMAAGEDRKEPTVLASDPRSVTVNRGGEDASPGAAADAAQAEDPTGS